ncbi:MAG: hypothetical protein AABY90_06130, partial [Nitrospirota bacterium]
HTHNPTQHTSIGSEDGTPHLDCATKSEKCVPLTVAGLVVGCWSCSHGNAQLTGTYLAVWAVVALLIIYRTPGHRCNHTSAPTASRPSEAPPPEPTTPKPFDARSNDGNPHLGPVATDAKLHHRMPKRLRRCVRAIFSVRAVIVYGASVMVTVVTAWIATGGDMGLLHLAPAMPLACVLAVSRIAASHLPDLATTHQPKSLRGDLVTYGQTLLSRLVSIALPAVVLLLQWYGLLWYTLGRDSLASARIQLKVAIALSPLLLAPIGATVARMTYRRSPASVLWICCCGTSLAIVIGAAVNEAAVLSSNLDWFGTLVTGWIGHWSLWSPLGAAIKNCALIAAHRLFGCKTPRWLVVVFLVLMNQ